MSPGSAAVMIASMGSISIPVEPELAQQLAHAPTDALLDIALGIRRFAPVEAYCLSKRGNQLRVNAAALRWGKRGAHQFGEPRHHIDADGPFGGATCA